MDRHKKTSRWLGESDSDSDSANMKRKRSENIKHYDQLKDMRKLDSNDEAFLLSWREIRDIINIIRLRKTPTPETYKQWDEYEASFYLKMCTCFDVDYQHLEPEDENEKKKLSNASQIFQIPFDMVQKLRLRMEKTEALLKEKERLENKSGMEITGVEKTPLLTKANERLESKSGMEITSVEKTQPLTKANEHLESKLGMEITGLEKTQPLTKANEHIDFGNVECTGARLTRSGPLKIGSYSPGTEPDRIPYHLYLLVKEVVDIMKSDNLVDLDTVEKKIGFFCTYFHTHLPTGWKYERANASSLIANYDTMRRPKYCMTGYTPTPLKNLKVSVCDVETELTEYGMADMMSIIHSRKTPTFKELAWMQISFYCKICSCFGIEYHRLEDASEDDVCLMNVGRNG